MAEPRIGWGVLRVEMGRPVRRLMHCSKPQMMVAWTKVVSVEMEMIPRYVLERNSRGLAGSLGTRGEGFWRGGHGRPPHFCLDRLGGWSCRVPLWGSSMVRLPLGLLLTLTTVSGQAARSRQLHRASPQLDSCAMSSVQPRPLREDPLD